MSYHALVIDDDHEIQNVVRDRLESLGHTCDTVGSQAEARDSLAKDHYSYVLLDLEIPVKYGRPSRIANGKNLIQEIRATRSCERTPILVITGNGQDGPELAVDVMKLGALDFITKPFKDTGQTLEKSIEEALEKSAREARSGGSKHRKHAQQPQADPELFTSGELVIYRDKVELCGVEICGGPGDCQIRSIIDALSEKTPLGKFRALSGQALAKKIKSERGQPAVAEAILKFRRKIAALMLTEANLKMGGKDFIDSGDWGYRFPEKISVRHIGKPEVDSPEPIITLQPPAAEAALNKRQQWFLAQVRKGNKVGRAELISQFKTSVATAKRDLTGLAKMIEFVGPARGGYYVTSNQ